MQRRMMRLENLWSLTLVVAALLITIGATGCSDDAGPVEMVPLQAGERGESCTARNDCKEGLACVRSTCVRNDYAISPSSGQCVLLECGSDAECCQGPDDCAEWKEGCDADPSSSDCQNLNFYCDCNFQCQDNQCRPGAACDDNADCGYDGICDDGTCVQCTGDEDCPGEERCVSGFCDVACSVDSNCPLFHSCEDGACIETGCQSDRECVHFAQHGDAICKNSECVVPCNNDAECNGGAEGSFEVCEGGKCIFIGCETDEECRVALDMENMPGNVRTSCEQ